MNFLRNLFGKKKSTPPTKRKSTSPTKKKSTPPTSGKKKFAKASTRDPEEAVDILFGKALAAVPALSATQLRTAYDRMREAWGDRPFMVAGSESELRSLILDNAKALSHRAGFNGFSISVCLADDGYQGEEAASLNAWVPLGGGRVGVLAHFWKTEDKFYAFSSSDFLGKRPSPE